MSFYWPQREKTHHSCQHYGRFLTLKSNFIIDLGFFCFFLDRPWPPSDALSRCFFTLRTFFLGHHDLVAALETFNRDPHCSKSSFFVQKFNFDFPRKMSIFLGWKNRENVVVLDFLADDNFDFTRKIVKKKFGWKTHENVGVLSKLNFWTKIWLFE